MAELILHHYAISAFSERVRLAMGLKRLRYRSVLVPPLMPKPDQVALTGGYRRAPVLQIGADVYCDTAAILPVIEALHPAPSLYPFGSEGVASALAWWADKALFPPALAVVANVNAGKIPRDFVTERKAFGFNLDVGEIGSRFPADRDQANAEVARLAAMLGDGRPFMLGDAPSAADMAAYCSIWLLQTQGGAAAEAVVSLAAVEAWAARVAAIGHGEPDELPSTEALAIARDTEPEPPDLSGGTDGLQSGETVTVTPDDTGRDPVHGALVAADSRTVIIRRVTPELGTLHLHFPRSGFDLCAAGTEPHRSPA